MNSESKNSWDEIYYGPTFWKSILKKVLVLNIDNIDLLKMLFM
jgi:hypothetical protein